MTRPLHLHPSLGTSSGADPVREQDGTALIPTTASAITCTRVGRSGVRNVLTSISTFHPATSSLRYVGRIARFERGTLTRASQDISLVRAGLAGDPFSDRVRNSGDFSHDHIAFSFLMYSQSIANRVNQVSFDSRLMMLQKLKSLEAAYHILLGLPLAAEYVEQDPTANTSRIWRSLNITLGTSRTWLPCTKRDWIETNKNVVLPTKEENKGGTKTSGYIDGTVCRAPGFLSRSRSLKPFRYRLRSFNKTSKRSCTFLLPE